MKIQDSSFNGLKVTVGTKSVTHPRTNGRSKSNMPHQLFQSWGHKHKVAFNNLPVISRQHLVETVNIAHFFITLPETLGKIAN